MSEFTKDTYLLQESFTEPTIDVLIDEGYKAYDRFAEAYLNYKNETTKPGTFNVYGGSYSMKNSEVPVEIGATNMTISSALYEGGFVEANTKFELTATNFINNGTISIIDESEDTYSVTFKSSNAEFVNNSSVTVSNAIFDVATVSNAANATFALTNGAVFTAASVTNSGSFSLDNAAFTATTVNNNAGATFNLTNDASIELAAVTNDGTFNIVKGNVAGKFSGTGTIEINTNTLEANTIDISGTGTVNLKGIASSKYVKLGSAKIEAATISSTKRVDLDGATLKATTATLADMRLSGTNTFDFGSLTAGTLYMMANSQIKGSNIGSESGTKATIQSWSSNPTVSISGENDLYATITNKGTLNIAAAGKIYTASIVNSGADSKIISDGANVVLGSEEKRVSLSNTKGLIGLEHNATVVASSISGDSGATYEITDSSVTAESLSLTSSCAFVVEGVSSLNIGTVSSNSTITLQKATISASSISGGKVSIPKQYDTGNGTPEEPAMADNTVTFSGDNSILSTITNNGAIIVNDTLTAGAVTNNGAITVNGTLTAGAVTNNSGSSLTLAKNATLNASSLTVDGGSLSLGVGSTVDLGEEGDLISSVGLTITSATVIADEIKAEGKALSFVTSNITANTITANTAEVRGNATMDVGTIGDTVMTIKSINVDKRTTITDSSIGTGSVNTLLNVDFVGTNTFDAITNGGKVTVSGSLTATSITNGENATFTVSAAGTQLNTKFTGTITFADGATLGKSSFGADSVITATNFAIADEAAVTLTVGEATKLNANISSGTINLVSGFDAETAPEWDLYQLINGTIGDDVTFTVDGVQAGSIKLGDETYGLIKLDTGLWLTKGQDNEKLYINAAYAGLTPGAKTDDGHIYGYNAFSSLRDPALSYNATGVGQDIKDAAKNAKNLVLTGSITDGRTLFYTDQPTVTITTTGENGASFTERLYLMHDIIYKKEGDSFVVYDKDGETPITQATLPEFILAEGAKLNGGSMLKVGESLDKDDYSEETGFTRTAGAVKLTVNGDIKSFIQVNPYSSVKVSKTGSVISESNGTGVTENEDRQSTYIRVNGSLTVNGDPDAELKVLQFKMQRLTFTDGGTLALNNTNAQFSRIRFYDEGFTIPTGKATITVTNSIVNNFENNALDNLEGGYNFFVYGASETAAVKSKQTVELTLDNSEMKVSDKAVFNPNANTTINVKNASTLTVGNVTNDGAINLENGAELDVNGAVTNNATGVINVGKAGDEDESELFANSIENAGTITVTDSTLNATVVNTSAVGAKFTVGGTSTLNISGTGSSLTGTITLADGANVKATIARGGTLNVAADTAATLAEGSSVASLITNAGTLTLDGVTKTGRITNNGTVNGSASTVGGIINNVGSVSLTGKSFSSVTVKDGTVSLIAESADTGIAVGSITNGTKGTTRAAAIDGTFDANGNVTGSGAITNNAGSIKVTGNLTLTPNSTTGVRPAITNGSIYTSGNIVQVGVGSIEVTGALTAGDFVNNAGATAQVSSAELVSLTNNGSFTATSAVTAGAITNGTAATTDPVAAAVEGSFSAAGLTASGDLVNNAGSVSVTGNAVFKKDTTLFDITNSASGLTGIEESVGFKVTGALTAGDFENKAGATAQVGSAELSSLTNNGSFTATGTVTTTGEIANSESGEIIVSGKITGASVGNVGTIEAGSIKTTGEYGLGNSGTIGSTSATAIETTILSNSGTIYASTLNAASINNSSATASITAVSIEGTGTASLIENAGSITATNVSAATVSTNGASFTVGGESSELNISKKLTGTITLADGANVTAMVKGGTLDVENGSTVSLTGAEGNTAAVTNLGNLTIAGGTIGAVTNKQVVVDKDTVKGTLTVESDKAIQTGAFTNNAIVNVNSAFTVKGNFNNQAGATITIDATKFDFTESNTVCAIEVTGTLTNAGEISVTGGAPGEYDLIVKNDGTDKGVYLYKNSDPDDPVDMSYLLVYSDLASQYKPGEPFPFGGHEYVYALSAFATATAMTKIGEDTEEIDFVTQSGTYGNLNLTLFADQEINVYVVNGTGKKVSADLNFNNLSIAASEAGEDEDVGAITFNNDVVTGAEVANTTVAISTATVDFQGANFSASKSVTIKDDAHVTFSDDFSAAAATITGSEVVFGGNAAFAGNAAITAGSEVYFRDEANFAGTANISGSTVYFRDEANFAGNATISGSTVAFGGAATFSNGETDGAVNATISGSTVVFGGAATVEGLLKLTGSEVTAEAEITASSTNLDKNSTLNLSTEDAKLGDLTTAAGSKINLTYQSKLSFTATAVQGNFDIDVTGLTSTKNTASATITGIPSVTKVSIVGNNTENNVAKYFNYNTENKTLTLIKEACNEIKVNSKSSLDNALKYTWEGDDGETYYADNVIVQDVTYADALYFVNAARTAHVNQYITIEGGEFQKSVFGGKKQETAGTGRFDVVDLGGNLNLTIEDGHFTRTVVAGDNIKVKGLFYREGTITTTISGGTFDYNFAGGLLYNLTDVTSQAIVTGTSLTINSETADTIFNDTVYGGNFSQKKAGSNCTFIDEKAIVRIEAGEENTIQMKALIVGSYGNGVIEKGTELTLTGNGDNLEIESVWGGCGSDYYTEDAKREYVTTMAANATRTLTFEGFKNTFNCTSIRGFSDVIVKSETEVTLINTDKYGLADASNWTFEFGSSLNGAFANNFAGDDLTLTGIEAMKTVAEGGDPWVICDNINFETFAFKGIKSINGATGDDLVFADNAYTFAAGDNQYKLSFGDYNVGESEETSSAMYLTRLA